MAEINPSSIVLLEAAHKYCFNNMPTLKQAHRCGCFLCGRIYDPADIDEWIVADNRIYKEGTAICPYCGVDSVLPENPDHYPLTKSFFLRDMQLYWFDFTWD